MDLQLAKKNAVVTGAASGVGRSIALCLSKEGVNVVISDIAMEKAANAADECRALGVKAHPVRTDLSQAEECVQLIDRAEELLGPVDILVNNAGIWPTNLVVDIPVEEWRKTFDVNLTAVFLTCQRFAQKVLARGGKGKILNIRILFPTSQRQHLLALDWQYPMRRPLRSRPSVRKSLGHPADVRTSVIRAAAE